MSTVKDYTPTQDAQDTIAKFTLADSQFKAAWNEFYETHQKEIERLDTLREERNVKLDESRKLLADEATRLDINRYKSFQFGLFQVQKKVGSDSFRAVEFVKLAKDLGVKKQMEDEGVIATKVEINFNAAEEFFKKNGLTDQFAITREAGKELTPAVISPKPIPAFAQEAKSK